MNYVANDILHIFCFRNKEWMDPLLLQVVLKDKDHPRYLAAIRKLQTTSNGLFTNIDMSNVRNNELGIHFKTFSYDRYELFLILTY